VATVRKAYDGLLSNKITAVVDDGLYGYVGTDKGLNVINLTTYEIYSLETDTPINKLVRSIDGTALWAATDYGVLEFDTSVPMEAFISNRWTTAENLYANRVVDMVELDTELWLAYAQDFSASAPVTDKITKYNHTAETGVDYPTQNYGAVNQTTQLFTYDSKIFALDNYCLMEINPVGGSIVNVWYLRSGAPVPQVAAVATQNGAELWLAYTDVLAESDPFITRFNLATFTETATFQVTTSTSTYETTTGALTWGDTVSKWGDDYSWGGTKTSGLPTVNDMFAQYIPQFISLETGYLAGENFGEFDADWGACLWLGVHLNSGEWGLIYVLTPEQWTPALSAVDAGDVPEVEPGIVRAVSGSRLLATNNGLLVWEGADFALFVDTLTVLGDEQDTGDRQQDIVVGGPDSEPGVYAEIIGMPPLSCASERRVREYSTVYGLSESFVHRVLEPFYGDDYWEEWW
jgi:hypothetical protein